jgi:hypothetical protein
MEQENNNWKHYLDNIDFTKNPIGLLYNLFVNEAVNQSVTRDIENFKYKTVDCHKEEEKIQKELMIQDALKECDLAILMFLKNNTTKLDYGINEKHLFNLFLKYRDEYNERNNNEYGSKVYLIVSGLRFFNILKTPNFDKQSIHTLEDFLLKINIIPIYLSNKIANRDNIYLISPKNFIIKQYIIEVIFDRSDDNASFRHLSYLKIYYYLPEIVINKELLNSTAGYNFDFNLKKENENG